VTDDFHIHQYPWAPIADHLRQLSERVNGKTSTEDKRDVGKGKG
jgi:hypothetical protein